MTPDHPHADDLEEIPDFPTPKPASPAFAAPAATGDRPPLRPLDKAPLHLRLAALIVTAGSLLPWMPGRLEVAGGAWWLMALAGKALMGVAAWLWLQQVLHDFGPRAQGVLGQLASLHLKPKPKPAPDDGKRRAKPKAASAMHLEHPFPTGLHALALVVALAGVLVAARDPRVGFANTSSGIPEVIMLGWAAFTWVHIAGYERWGAFNPLFPLMFLGMLFAGVMGVLGALGGDAGGLLKLAGLAGGAAVAAGGGLAAYTIVEAMMQAKKEGDRKKAEALEARKASRGKKA
jgi:hypothetical protein